MVWGAMIWNRSLVDALGRPGPNTDPSSRANYRRAVADLKILRVIKTNIGMVTVDDALEGVPLINVADIKPSTHPEFYNIRGWTSRKKSENTP